MLFRSLVVLGSTAFHMADFEAARRCGVNIANTPGYATDAVAEHAIALMLAAARVIPAADQAMRRRPFHIDEVNSSHDRYCGSEIRGKTLGIVGLGAIGRRVAEIGNGLGMRVLAYNRTAMEHENIRFTGLDELLQTSDVVTVHLALTAHTVNFIGAEPFRNGVAKLLALMEEKTIGNIRIHDDDVRYLLEKFPPASLSRIYVLYPDPWPKKRHHGRRIVNAETLKQFHALLKLDGVFLFASDIDDYIEWTLREVREHGGFELVGNSPEPFENWFRTRYEAKAKREGRETRYLRFQRGS